MHVEILPSVVRYEKFKSFDFNLEIVGSERAGGYILGIVKNHTNFQILMIEAK